VGVYAVNNSMFDLYMLLGIGLVAYVLEKLDYPSAPIVLGVILGPLAESQLRLALTISGGNASAIASSPISMILIALTLFVLVAPLWRAWQDSRKAATA
jgi:putative tricarboxylic transport membrane protein